MALPANEFGASFFLGVAGVLSAALALCMKSLYKSKCYEISCCGLSVKRNIDIELQEDLATCVAATPEDRRKISTEQV